MSQHPEPLVIDVDTGIDDAFALLYACAHDEARILGVSTVVGNVSLAAATRNTRAVMALAGRADIPVWTGAATAISVAVKDASEISWQDRPRPCCSARAGRAGACARAACRGFDHRRGAVALRAPHSVRDRAVDEYCARRHARAGTAASRQAVRHHGRRLFRARQSLGLNRSSLDLGLAHPRSRLGTGLH